MEAKTKIDEAKLKSEFAASADLQAEFGSVEAYVCFMQALAEGRIRGLKSNVPVHTSSAEPGPGPAVVDEESLKREFAESADLKSEFGNVESYVAFKQADARGQVKLGRGIPIPEKVGEAFAEAARISQAINERRDQELRQYQNGIPCDANGVPCES